MISNVYNIMNRIDITANCGDSNLLIIHVGSDKVIESITHFSITGLTVMLRGELPNTLETAVYIIDFDTKIVEDDDKILFTDLKILGKYQGRKGRAEASMDLVRHFAGARRTDIGRDFPPPLPGFHKELEVSAESPFEQRFLLREISRNIPNIVMIHERQIDSKK